MGQTIAEKIFESHHVDNPSGDIHVINPGCRLLS